MDKTKWYFRFPDFRGDQTQGDQKIDSDDFDSKRDDEENFRTKKNFFKKVKLKRKFEQSSAKVEETELENEIDDGVEDEDDVIKVDIINNLNNSSDTVAIPNSVQKHKVLKKKKPVRIPEEIEKPVGPVDPDKLANPDIPGNDSDQLELEDELVSETWLDPEDEILDKLWIPLGNSSSTNSSSKSLFQSNIPWVARVPRPVLEICWRIMVKRFPLVELSGSSTLCLRLCPVERG